MKSGKSVLIVGGGVIGLCTAYYAQKKGFRVTLVERSARDHQGCSLGNAGMIVPSHFIPLAAPGMVSYGLKMILSSRSPFGIRPRLSWELASWCWKFFRSANAAHVERSAPILLKLNRESRELYEELASELSSDFGLVKKGLLMLCKTPPVLQAEVEVAKLAEKLGIPAQVLSANEISKLDPSVQYDVAGGVHFPLDCHLNPNRFVAALTSELEKLGAEFFWNTEIRNWRTRDGKIESAVSNSGEIRADEFVIAGGAWSPGISRSLGIRLPMQAGKGYSMTLTDPRQLPSICSILTEARVAVTPMDSSLRFAGTMEICGNDLSISKSRVSGLIDSIPTFMPEFTAEDFSAVSVWSGLRPCSPDGLPYIGRTKDFSNLSIATGHAMMGLSLAPVTGKMIADSFFESAPQKSAELDPCRFH